MYVLLIELVANLPDDPVLEPLVRDSWFSGIKTWRSAGCISRNEHLPLWPMANPYDVKRKRQDSGQSAS